MGMTIDQELIRTVAVSIGSFVISGTGLLLIWQVSRWVSRTETWLLNVREDIHEIKVELKKLEDHTTRLAALEEWKRVLQASRDYARV